ncbi:TonB-dependent receptor [Pedobacter sp. MC2016-14]|uniref:SusC/RagA family TonB-linked outer membrane protein n=1 Tax=Pedobacter sp. MC2016-14 TaxID=2897327 RepID=UPI001E64A7A5|nr:TonB-dependent receptor [Pedobacter sp. MC2016-14]MCD0487114.1 TonB-dependent receptor [Pedobacter sp. MC2016-14]
MKKLKQKFCLRSVSLLILLLGLAPSLLFAQSILKGKVLDEKGMPLPGAGIKLKISGKATVTDNAGNFTISAPQNEKTLIISFIGYPSQEIEIKSGTTLYNIVLSPDAKNLNEVVVIGFGTQKRKDVTGAIVSLSGSAIKDVPVANIQQALQGRLAGVEVQSTGTRPGSNSRIRIRGERSIYGLNDPLVVLDGIPFSDNGGGLNDINPDDIATIDVLKDASATAIYGSRGANGVILVTSKRGIAGDTRVSLNSYYGFSEITRKYDVYNADQYRALRDYSIYNQDYLADEKQGIASGRNTDWQDLLYKNGYMTDNNITVSGGSDQSQFSFGGGYFKQTSVLPSQDFSRGSFKATGDFKIGKRIKVGFNNITNYSINNGAQFGLNVFPLLSLSPLSSPLNPDGSINKKPAGNLDDLNTTYNPLLLKTNENQWVDRVRRFRTFNSLFGEVEIYDGLKYRLNVGLDFNQEEGGQFRGADSYFRPGLGNTATVTNGTGTKYALDNLLTYEKTIAEKHRISVTGLFGIEKQQFHSTSITKDSITSDFVQFYNLGLSSVGPTAVLGGSEVSSTLIAAMLRANYVYDDKYMITLTGRSDGSSRLGVGNKWKQYPAISLGWSITDEEFMKNLKTFSNLKLRAGYGITASQAVPAYSTLGGVTSNGVRYNYGNSSQTGYYVSKIVDPNLDWEYTKTTNVGLDFGILSNRITGSIDWYTAKTDKLLFDIPLPPTAGVSEPYLTNAGNVSNKGLEVALSSINIKSENGFSWSTDLNFSFNRNKVDALYGNVTQIVNAQLFIGQPLSALYDYKKLGIWQTDEAAEAAKYGFVPGQLKLEDHNGDGKLTVDDKYVIGSGQADIQGGMTNRFSFKGFDFSFVLYARFGGTLVSQVHQPLAGYLTINDGRRNQIAVDYWTPTNPTNSFPSPNVAGGLISSPLTSDAGTTLGYFDASFIKVRSINLGYSFSSDLAKKLGAQKFKIYVAAQNPFILYSPYVKAGGIDPEPNGTGNQGVQNPGNITSRALTIGANIPPTRAFLAGLNVTF